MTKKVVLTVPVEAARKKPVLILPAMVPGDQINMDRATIQLETPSGDRIVLNIRITRPEPTKSAVEFTLTVPDQSGIDFGDMK